MPVIVVDVLEIVDVEEGERKTGGFFPRRIVFPLQQLVDAMLDYPPRRQAGQFVIVGHAEQGVFKGLLPGDVGGARQQQIALGNADRPVAGEQHLRGGAVCDGFFHNGALAGAQQFGAGFAAMLHRAG